MVLGYNSVDLQNSTKISETGSGAKRWGVCDCE